MKKSVFAVLCCLVSIPAFSADTKMNKETQKAGEVKGEASGDMMGAWQPRKITNEKETKRELEATFKSMDDAMMKNDLTAMASMIDFPVMMVTDDSKGQAMGEDWNKEQWTKTCLAKSKNMPTDMKSMKTERKYELITDSLAVVTGHHSMTMNGKAMSWRSGGVVVKKDGQWKMKSMIEGGWGDMKGQPSSGTGGSGPMGGSDSGSMGGGNK